MDGWPRAQGDRSRVRRPGALVRRRRRWHPRLSPHRPFDAGGLLYVSRHDLEQEWVSPLAEADRDEIEGLYKALGGILHQEIWGNPRYAYHPVLLVETADGGEEEVWYLFLQPSQDVRRTSDTEVCYAYHTKSKRFEQVPHSRRYDMIRGLVEARGGGGCESDEGAAPLRG